MQDFIEALKEGGRVVALAVVPVLIDSLNKREIDWIAVAVVAGVAFLRFVDKYLHEKAPDGVAGGLTRF